MNKKLGEILAFSGSWGSGLAQITLRDVFGRVETVFCDNGPTVRALAAAYPDDEIITRDHCVNVVALRGKQILYEVNSYGIMEWFSPIEQAEIEI